MIINKIKKLEEFLENKKVVLAFSAGSDSTLLAYILSKVSSDSLLVTIDNNMFPQNFIEYTAKQARKFNLKHKVIKLNFLECETFIHNRKERCYECRRIMYSQISKLPEFKNYDLFIEGTNITDLLEDRPGVLVKELFNLTSPLVECEITKDEVYEMIDYFNLEYSHDTTCLATRIKSNAEVNKSVLEKINHAENIIRNHIKQENIRVRTDEDSAVITVDNPMKIMKSERLENVKDELLELGFKKVLIDITGYRKTCLKYNVDENGNYYYQLPYRINLEKSLENLEDDAILNDVKILENGKISMPPCIDFDKKMYKILKKVRRKEV